MKKQTNKRQYIVNSLLSGSFLIKLFSFSSDKDRKTDSRIRRKNTAQPRRESNPGSCEVFSSDPAVSFSIFVGAEREEFDQYMYVQLWPLLLLFLHFIFVYFTIFILVFNCFITFVVFFFFFFFGNAVVSFSQMKGPRLASR